MISDYKSGKCLLVTGAAGFVGFHLIRRLAQDDWFVIGTDNINDYYDVNLKYARLAEWGIPREEIRYNKLVTSCYIEKCSFIQLNLEDTDNLTALFENYDIRVVCHLGAQAGVRYSIENPMAYVNSNVVGFTNILENCRKQHIEHLVYASSSSVYGLNAKMPFSTHDSVDHPVSFYAATKKANELMAHVYSHLYKLPTTGLRFFTVYGPWGRPDMSPMLFADAIMNGKPINVFNHGNMGRDFTYIDDIIDGVVRVLRRPPSIYSSDIKTSSEQQVDNMTTGPFPLDPSCSTAPYRVYNIGSSSPVKLIDYIEAMEKALGRKAIKKLLPMQPGDVLNTYCDVSDLERDFGYRPKTTLKEGLEIFATWYKEWYTGKHPLIKEKRVVVGKYPISRA